MSVADAPRLPPCVVFVDDEADIRAANVQSLTLAGLTTMAFDNAEAQHRIPHTHQRANRFRRRSRI